jgi:hypothetical protein
MPEGIGNYVGLAPATLQANRPLECDRSTVGRATPCDAISCCSCHCFVVVVVVVVGDAHRKAKQNTNKNKHARVTPFRIVLLSAHTNLTIVDVRL